MASWPGSHIPPILSHPIASPRFQRFSKRVTHPLDMALTRTASLCCLQLRSAQGETTVAKREAQTAYDKALALRNLTQGNSDMFSELLRRMEDFENIDGARPAEIRAVRFRLMLVTSRR